MRHTTTSRQPMVRTAVVAATVCLGMLSSACGGGPSEEPVADAADAEPSSTIGVAETPAFGLVAPGEAVLLAADPEVTVVDVRTPEEFADGHLDGALLIDFYADTFADRLAELDVDGTHLLYCRSGNRSGQATAIMTELGHERVYDLEGGVIAWDGQGQPLVR